MEWIDTHCHLNEDAFTPDVGEVVQRAVDVGVRQMLVVGITRESSQRAVELATQYPPVSAVVGIQPNYVRAAEPDDFLQIEQLARSPKVVAVGETGLDRYWDHSPLELQVDYFRRHLALSRATGLPFVIHCREAEDDVIRVLREARQEGPLQGVMHCFCGDQAAMEACVELGLYISFAGMVTFKRSDALRAVAARVPADRLLVETDAPYLAPAPHREKRNEPGHVRFTANCLAEVRGVSPEELAEQTTSNARALFGLPSPDGV